MTLVHLNGEFVAPGEARISAFDAAVQHGVGLFETMLASGGGVRRLGEHLQRLARSARRLQLVDSLDVDALGDLVLETVRRSGLAEQSNIARVRLTITGGDLNLRERASAPQRHMPGVLIVCQPATIYPTEMYERGVRVTVADLRVNPLDPLSGHKTINYWSRLMEVQRAHARGASEALVFQVTNHLAGGAVSNVFLAQGGRLLTPIARGEEDAGAIASPVLPGITRLGVLEHAQDMGIEVQRRMLTIDDVIGADEVFVTNSGWGVLPVVAVEGSKIGDCSVGEIARTMLQKWREELG